MKRAIIGLDLGQTQDYSALGIGIVEPDDDWVRRFQDRHKRDPHPKETPVHLQALKRYKLRTPYPQIVDNVIELRGNLIDQGFAPELVVDGTGVGRAVVDVFHERGWKPVHVTITGGKEKPHKVKGEWRVPKKDLIGALQGALQLESLLVAESLPLASEFTKEALSMKVRITTAGNPQFDTWRVGAHDDIVLAVACLVWWAQRSRPTIVPMVDVEIEEDEVSPEEWADGFRRTPPR